MEERRYVLPSNVYPSQQDSLDTSRPRLPLTDSTGNAQYHTVATANIYSCQKGQQPRPPTNFLLPTLPSQPACHHTQRTALEVRRSNIRSQRAHRTSAPNPIVESEQYQAYRSRQVKSDDAEQKWPDDLEDLFLEALCLLPNMGRRKFSLNGKPHGRNELISLYLWMGHCESLSPGQAPDPSRQRTRKQVSSHIQVLKGFMRNHPAFDRLFPPKNAARNSFKNDPCLRALAQGHLPHKRLSQDLVSSMDSQPSGTLTPPARQLSLSPYPKVQYLNSPIQSLRPSLFKMYMTTLRPGFEFKDVSEDDAGDGKLSTKVHTYSDSTPRAIGHAMLEKLPDWRVRFPILAQLEVRNEIKCDIIHLEASLELRYGSLPERSELWGRFELVVPGKHNRQSVWRCTQSLYKPADLCGSPTSDPRFENVTSTPQVNRHEAGVGTYIRVNFPALPWAYALQRLSTLQAQFEEAVETGAPLPTPTTARQYIDQISMFQEIFCSVTPDQPFIRKAILLWTFKKCKAGERGLATWRYLEPPPPRSACFSPHPGSSHVVSAAMAENFAAWAEGIPQALQIPPPAPTSFDLLSPFESLQNPLQSVAEVGDLPFPFPTYGYPAAENPSFTSHGTQESDSTLIDVQNSGVAHMDSYISSADALSNFNHGPALWETSVVQNFDGGPAFLADYSVGPSDAVPQMWDGDDAKGDNWDVADGSFTAYDVHLDLQHK